MEAVQTRSIGESLQINKKSPDLTQTLRSDWISITSSLHFNTRFVHCLHCLVVLDMYCVLKKRCIVSSVCICSYATYTSQHTHLNTYFYLSYSLHSPILKKNKKKIYCWYT